MTATIIDVNTLFGFWPKRKADISLDTLLRLMEEKGISKAFTLSSRGIFYDFIKTFDMEMVAGRSFSREFSSDVREAIIINEAMAKRFGWTPEEALNKRLRQQNGLVLKVVGVVKDFNYTSLAQPITPFALELPRNAGQMSGFWLRTVLTIPFG